MSDEPTGRSSKTAAFAAILAVLPLLYVLSIGPLVCILQASSWCRRRPRLINAVMIVYSPLMPLYTNEYLGPPFQGYLNWWDELAVEPCKGPDPFAPAAEASGDPFAQEPDSTPVQDPK